MLFPMERIVSLIFLNHIRSIITRKRKLKLYVYNQTMNLQDFKNKTFLLFGKPRAFNREEFNEQMRAHQIAVTSEPNDEVALLIEGRMMTPYEQNAADKFYEEGVYDSLSIEVLEKALAEAMDDDVLLMSLKLSRDKERLKSFLQNSMLSDELFFKLIKMYSWGGEDFFDNDDNRDVSAAFIARFYENIERNHNVQYATTGFRHLISQAKSSLLLEAIASLEPIRLHPKMKMAIAMSPYLDETMQEKFFKNADGGILEALSFNTNLQASLVEKLVKYQGLGDNIAKTILLDEVMFENLRAFDVSLARNETLTLSMQEQLFALKNSAINLSLAHNNKLHVSIIQKLLLLKNEELMSVLYENSATPVSVLEEAYKDEKNHMALAKNESTPVEILYQLQLDSRYERQVKTNAAFGKHIQSENIGWL